MFDCVFINGTVGTGKSTVANALGQIAEAAGRPNAVIDLDHLRWAWPAPQADPFNHELELRNLAAVAANYREVGISSLILAGVVEIESELDRYRNALQTKRMIVCRLEAEPEVISARLRIRHSDDPAELRWSLARAGELARLLREANVDDLVVDSSTWTSKEIARRLAHAAGWI